MKRRKMKGLQNEMSKSEINMSKMKNILSSEKYKALYFFSNNIIH